MLLGLLALLGWTLLQGARVAYRAAWYGIADPMPIEAPVIWSMATGHARRLDAMAHRLDACLPVEASVAIDPAAVGLDPDQTFFWSLWLAHFLPGHDIRPVRPGSNFRAGADFWMTRGGGVDTESEADAGVRCTVGGLAITELDRR